MNKLLRPAAAVMIAAAAGLVGDAPAQQSPPSAGLSPAEAARSMKAPEGFRVTLFAGEPDIRQPIALALDDRGRLWVAENYIYPRWTADGGKDRILIFEDTDGDGTFDRRSVFVDGLNFVSGVEVGFGGVWVTAPPCLLFYPVQPGSDRPSGPPEIRLDGWEHQDTHNLVNNLSWGPDGWLYGCQGIATRSRVGIPGTKDADRVFMDTGIWRYHPLKRRFEVFSEGGSNPWGIDFDDRGQAISVQCVIPHLHRMIQGGRHLRLYGRHPQPHTYADIPHIGDHVHWIGDKPHSGNGKSDTVGGGHAHAGVMVYLGDSFPAEYRNRVFANNIHGRRVVTDILERTGSGYVGRHGPDFLLSGDPTYRGLNLTYGPDGSVYILDWSDKTACHFFGPEAYDRSNGRIFKVAYGKSRPFAGDLAARKSAELVELQLHPNDWYVRHARRILQERGPDPEVHRALEEILFRHPEESRRLRALWALHATGGLKESIARKALVDRFEFVRAWTLQLLGEEAKIPPVLLETIAELAQTDPSLVVRLYLAALLQRLPLDDRWEIGAALLAHGEDRQDPALPLMVWYGVEPLDGAGGRRALRLAARSKIPLVREFMARRHAETRDTFAELLIALEESTADENRRDLLKGMRDGVKGRRGLALPDGWTALAATLDRSSDPEVRSLARDVGVALGDLRAAESLRRLLADATADPAARSLALDTLLAARDPALAPVLRSLLKERALRGPAIRALAAYGDPEAASALLDLYSALGPAERRDALNTLSGRSASAKALMEALRRGAVPKQDFTAAVIRQLSDLRDPELAEKIGREWGSARPTPEERVREINRMRQEILNGPPGDPSAGRAVFERSCMQCHTLFDVGGKVGPEITGGNRSDLEYLLVNLMDPSAVVGRDYTATTIRTTGGRIITGIVRKEDRNTVTLATENDTVVIPVPEIDARRQSEVSMMPEGLLQNLKPEERRNLIAYLRSPTQVPRPGSKD